MSKLRLGILGDGAWATNSLMALLQKPKLFDIQFVCARHSKPDLDFIGAARQNNITVLELEEINSSSAVSIIERHQIDYLLSISYDQIFKRHVISNLSCEILNFHAGALPKYRGRNVLNWALINGEKSFGLTSHYISEGIDRGDIIYQVDIPIADNHNYGSLLDLASKEMPNLVMKTLGRVANPNFIPTNQAALGKGFYCSARRDGDEWIDWGWSSQRINNFIRGISLPGPGARFAIGRNQYVCLRSKLLSDRQNYIDIEGAIVGKTPDGVIVKTGDNVILLCSCAAIEDIQQSLVPAWPIGTRLSGLVDFRLHRLGAAKDLDT